MTPKKLFEIFKENFNWFIPHVVKFTSNRADGGIDISLDTGEILNFTVENNRNKRSWILKRK